MLERARFLRLVVPFTKYFERIRCKGCRWCRKVGETKELLPRFAVESWTNPHSGSVRETAAFEIPFQKDHSTPKVGKIGIWGEYEISASSPSSGIASSTFGVFSTFRMLR